MTVSEEAEEMGLGSVEVVEMDSDPSFRLIVKLCDPRTQLNSEIQFISFWIRARAARAAVTRNYTHPTTKGGNHKLPLPNCLLLSPSPPTAPCYLRLLLSG